MVEYGDYECPYCAEAYPIVKKIIKELQSDICFVFRNFPLSEIHPYALHAAYAAEAAGKQGKFWEMHDMLYEHQNNLENPYLFEYAKQLQLDQKKFQNDFASSIIKEKVENDFMSGIESGVNGTPTFFINGERFDKGYEYTSLYNALEKTI